MPRPADVELHHTYNAPVPEGAARCCVMLPITPNYFQLRGVRLLPAGIRENDRQWTGGGDRRQTPMIHSRPATPRRGLNSTATTGCGDPGRSAYRRLLSVYPSTLASLALPPYFMPASCPSSSSTHLNLFKRLSSICKWISSSRSAWPG